MFDYNHKYLYFQFSFAVILSKIAVFIFDYINHLFAQLYSKK